MLITQSEYQTSLTANAGFIARCSAFKALLKENDLPVSVDLQTLLTAYKTNQFAALMKIDKGLTARYAMLRTDEAKVDLINAYIDLNGYAIVDELAVAIKDLARAYSQVWIGSYSLSVNGVTLSDFAAKGLDLETLAKSCIVDWTGKEMVLETMQTIGKQLLKLIAIGKELKSSGYDFGDVGHDLARFYDADGNVNELNAYQIANELAAANKLDIMK